MKQHLNEVKRMQQLAGLINENIYGLTYNEEYGNMESFERLKNIVDSMMGAKVTDIETFSSDANKSYGNFVIRFKGSNARIECSFNFNGFDIKLTNAYFIDYDDFNDYEYQIKDQDSLAYIQNNLTDFSDLKEKIIQSLEDKKYLGKDDTLFEVRQLVRKTINEINQLDEYEINDVVPGIRMNDEGEYDIDYGLGLELYNDYVKDKSTIGILAGKLKRMGIPEDQLLKVAYAIQDKYSEIYRRNKSRRY